MDDLTTAEVATQLGVTPQAVSLMVRRRTLQPARKLPGLRGAYLFSPDTIRELVDAKQEQSA